MTEASNLAVSPSRKRGSKLGKQFVTELIFRQDAATLPIADLLKLNDEAKKELEKIEDLSFNIFTLRETT